MGGGTSKAASNENNHTFLDDASDDEEQVQCCFWFQPKKKSTHKKQHDALGTPIPDTPLNQRVLRRKLMLEQQHDNPIFSSRYSGLEKEASSRLLSPLSNQTLVNSSSSLYYESQPPAQVHQGEDAERLLYAKYDLLEVLGVGSTSTCHRCVCKESSREFACKIIDKQHVHNKYQGMMEQFHREIQTLRNLRHPNIIQLYDVYLSQERIYIVMELMEGGELFDYVVEKGTLNEEEASRIIRKVTSALVYMHSKDIIHRDLKPENLLLLHKPRSPYDLEVKIIDFGLSKRMVEPVARSFLGTRGYLAPEMLQRRDYSQAVDAWALGVIAFVLLCGCLPFDDDSQTVPSDALIQARFVLRFPKWTKNLSDSAKNLLSHLLDINPKTRYTAEQALQHEWVQGKTALSSKMLSSPGRIIQHKTPPSNPNSGSKNPNGTKPPPPPSSTTSTKQYVVQNYTHRRQANGASTPTRVLVRKTSI